MAVVEFIAGGLGVLAGLLVLLAGGAVSGVSGAGGLGAVVMIIAVLVLAVSALWIYTGIQVLALKERGRMLSLILGIISVVLNLGGMSQSGGNTGSAVVSLAIDGFIIYVAVSQKDAFTS